MSIQDFFDSCGDGVDVSGNDSRIVINWSRKGWGFGQFHFYKNEKGQLMCSNECMSKESVKEILGMMVDLCELEDKRCEQCKKLLRVHEDGTEYCPTCVLADS